MGLVVLVFAALCVRLVILAFVCGGALQPDMGISGSACAHMVFSVGGWSFLWFAAACVLVLLALIAILWSCGVALVILMLAVVPFPSPTR